MDALRTENVTLQVADGTTMNAFVATPGDGESCRACSFFRKRLA